jgi:hypothetical protein
MSPEQARGQETDFRSDVYSLGIVIFELFAGRAPFVGSTPVATLLQHVEAEPPFHEPVAAPIPDSLRPVLAQALAKDPAQRQETGTWLLSALETARQDSLRDASYLQQATRGTAPPTEDSLATLTQVSTGARRTRGTTRRRWLALAALLAGLSAFAAGARWLRSNSELPAPAGVRGAGQTPPAQSPISDDEEAVRQVLGAYAWVLRTRDVAAFERLKPSLSPEQKTTLEASFRAIRSHKVSMTIDSVEINGNQAVAIVTRHDTVNDRLMPPIRQLFALSRSGDSWRIDSMGEPPAPAAFSLSPPPLPSAKP